MTNQLKGLKDLRKYKEIVISLNEEDCRIEFDRKIKQDNWLNSRTDKKIDILLERLCYLEYNREDELIKGMTYSQLSAFIDEKLIVIKEKHYCKFCFEEVSREDGEEEECESCNRMCCCNCINHNDDDQYLCDHCN